MNGAPTPSSLAAGMGAPWEVTVSRISTSLALTVVLLAAIACGQGATAVPSPATGEGTREREQGVDAAVEPRDGRLLGISVNEGRDSDYDAAMLKAKELGLQVVELSLAWDDLEAAPYVYRPEPDYLAIANQYYPLREVAVALVITPIDTNNLRLPEDLRGRPMDDPELIERFNRLLDYVFSRIPDTELVSLAIGNEVDVYLGQDAEAWQAYGRFFEAGAAHARSLRPGLPVGVKITYEGLTGSERARSASLNRAADLVMATYYPLNADFSVREPEVVGADWDALVELYPDREIHFPEVGYPSSPVLGGSAEKQARFVEAVFRAWDRHAGQIRLVNFVWLHDITEEQLQAYSDYYGVRDGRFLAYLGSLGLRSAAGEDKPALGVLQEQARRRGW